MNNVALPMHEANNRSNVAAPMRRRLGDLRNLSPSLFGFAFVRAFNDITLSRFEDVAGPYPLVWQDVMLAAMVPIFLLCIFLSKRILPLSSKHLISVSSPLLMMSSVVLFEAAPFASSCNDALLALSAIAAGLGAAMAILMWAELQSSLNSFRIVLYVSGAFLMGSILGWMAEGLDPGRLACALLALPAISSLSLAIGFSKIPSADRPAPLQHSSQKQFVFPWKLVIVLGVYEFVFGIRQTNPETSSDIMFLGMAAAALTLFCLAYFSPDRFDFSRIYRTPFALMTCGLLCALTTIAANDLFANAFISVGYSLMFLALTILLCDIAHRHALSAALLCSIEEIAMSANILGHIASALGQNTALMPLGERTASALLAALVVIASMALLSERESSRWGLSFFGVKSIDPENDMTRLTRIANSCALSPREKEVFYLLAEGKSNVDIEQQLYIAKGTLKSHTQRIYRKLGIHTRQELESIARGEKTAGRDYAE